MVETERDRGSVEALTENFKGVWREDLVGAVEESPLLEAVTRERLEKTQQTERT
jgi:hypothetical protein